MRKLHLIIIRKKYGFFIAFLLLLSLLTLFITISRSFSSKTTFDPVKVADINEHIPNKTIGKLAIIIDDFGQNRKGVKEIMEIDRPLTFAVMPFLAFTKSDAENAHKKGYEVIVHLPLEANGGKISWVGPRPIMTTTEDDEVHSIVEDAFIDVPYAVGANIHMGSKASSDERIISIILDYIKGNELYFVDSRTCSNPIAKKIADTKEALCFERDVFLDGKKPKSYIKNQLQKAADIALKRGKAIAIGHVGVEGGEVTAEAITEMLSEFDKKNVELIPISELRNQLAEPIHK